MVEPLVLVAAGLVLAGAAAVVSDAVPLTRLTVFAAAPWPVAAGAVLVAGRAGRYGGTDLSAPLLAGAVCGVAVGAWVLFAHLAALRGLPHRERYLVASGVGAAGVVLVTLLGRAEGLAQTGALWLVVAPVMAALPAACGYYALGLVYTDALVAFRLSGLYVVWTVVVEGVAAAVAVTVLGADAGGVVAAGVLAVIGVAVTAPSPWLLLPAHTLVGVLLVGGCGWLARESGPAGYGLALGVSALSLGSATVVLLSAALLG